MNWNIPLIGLCAALTAASVPLAAQTQPEPKSVALCLPPGAKAPVACGTARAGQPMNLVISTTSLPTGPVSLLFSEEDASGRAPRTARADVSAAALNADGSYSVVVPRELCGGGGSQGQFEIQDLMSSFNQAENRARPIGTVTIAC